MFYAQITLRNGLPFDVELPNETTIQALNDSRSGKVFRVQDDTLFLERTGSHSDLF